MATPLLQKARQRKMIYFGLIAVLFTVSLIQRQFVLKPLSYALQLRESSRGEVELTSSAIRLMLTGSRGIAVTMLWYNAMDMQKRNEWHELELIVKSITKLQPYFITPWLYQSWNLSFNVAVECDQPRDKYFYISRGMELLAEGERRNRGTAEAGSSDKNKVAFPGNPDMRYYMGFFYQLKIGTSDERLTMRCLLEMSCIDPVERNPDRFWTKDEQGKKQVDLEKFARFTQKYPRLVRRLYEQLGFENPEKIVDKFLRVNQDIPNRFKPVEKDELANLRQSDLKNPLEQFPLLPPHEENYWPDPTEYDLTRESVGVFLMSRTWYEFSQKPLPPPNPMPGVRDPDYDKMQYRVPKQMMIQLFRLYPPRAQVYIAETLESEGFFDREGWMVPKEWFETLVEKQDSEFADEEGRFVVGREAKYHSRDAWAKGYEMYKKYGTENGMYIEPLVMQRLERQARLARDGLKLQPNQMPQNVPPEWRLGERAASVEAHLRLKFNLFYRQVSNFDAFLNQSEGEKDPITSSMRRLLYEAERRRKREPPSEEILQLYEQAWGMYLYAALEHPKFAQVSSMQDDMYEVLQRYLREQQRLYQNTFKKMAVWLAYRSLGPSPVLCWPDAVVRYQVVNSVSPKPPETSDRLAVWFAQRAPDPLLSLPEIVTSYQVASMVAQEQADLTKERPEMAAVLPIKKRWGSLDRIRYYDGPKATELREALFLFTHGADMAMSPNFASTLLAYPGRATFMLTRSTYIEDPVAADWPRLILEATHSIVDNRLGLNR